MLRRPAVGTCRFEIRLLCSGKEREVTSTTRQQPQWCARGHHTLLKTKTSSLEPWLRGSRESSFAAARAPGRSGWSLSCWAWGSSRWPNHFLEDLQRCRGTCGWSRACTSCWHRLAATWRRWWTGWRGWKLSARKWCWQPIWQPSHFFGCW